MDNEKFNRLVTDLEAVARRNPTGYTFRVLLLAMLGNAYLALVLLVSAMVLLALLVSIKTLGVLAVKLMIVVAIFLWIMLKAIWVKIPPPQGFEIKPKDAPELFAMIKELSTKLGAPRFHRVLVTEDMNAGVVQAPRLGIFGWHCNYLIIGLTLLKSLTVEQFKSVLAQNLPTGGRSSTTQFRAFQRHGRTPRQRY